MGQLTLLSTVGLLFLWCGVSFSGLVPPMFLPTPYMVLLSLVDMYQEGILLQYTWDSCYRIIVGFALAAIVAVPMGVWMGYSRRASQFFRPTIEFMRYLPVVAMVPLMVLYFGIGDLQKLAVIFVGTFFQLVLMVADVTSHVPRDLLRAAYTLGAKPSQCLFHVLLPASLPGIFDNLRITIGWAWTYLVVAELVAANSGLGYMILKSQRFLQTDRIFAGLMLIGLLGVLTDLIFKIMARKLLPWSEKVEG